MLEYLDLLAIVVETPATLMENNVWMKDSAHDKGTLAITYTFETRGVLLCDSKTLLRLPSSAMDAHRFKVRTRPKFRGRFRIGISVNSLAARVMAPKNNHSSMIIQWWT